MPAQPQFSSEVNPVTVKLFSPIQIGAMTLKNRVVMPGLTSNFASADGHATDQLISYLCERAKGGVGLILVESAFTDLSGKGTPRQLGIHDDSVIPALRRLTDSIHRHGAKVGIQIMHCGRQMTDQFSGSQPVAPSPIASPAIGVVPRELTVSEIQTHVRKFAEAADRAVQAGFDCIEFVASHGYLISSFLSPYSNHRTDEYGGDLSGRMRFLREVISQTRLVVGPVFPILVRINASEYVPGGIEIEDAKQIAQELESLGVDAIDVSVSVKESYHRLSASTGEPWAGQAHLAAEIKRVVRVPVITAGRIVDRFTAERILDRGQADLVAMGRALIADPHLVEKMQTGSEEIIPCIGCNACNQRTRRPQIICVTNSLTGAEFESRPALAPVPKRIAVLGGGLAGLEFACSAAGRGHKVTIFPCGPLGGLTYYRGLVPGMEEFHKAVAYFQNRCRRLDVRIELRHPTPDNSMVEELEAQGFDTIVDARWQAASVPVRPAGSVLAADVLCGAQVGKSVCVLGDGLLACEVALYLADRGHHVTGVSAEHRKVRDAHPTVAFYLQERMDRAGVMWVPETPDLARYDSVVLPHGFRDVELTSRLPVVHLGDAYEASDLAERVFKGGAVGRAI